MPLSLRTSLKRLAERATGTAHLRGQRAAIANKLAVAKAEPAKTKSMPVPPATAATPFDDPATVAWFADGGLVPFPAAEPRAFVRAENAIRLEAGLLLERARAEFSRRYLVRVDAMSDEARAGYTRVLQGQLRIAELEAAARDPEDEEHFWGSDEVLVEHAANINRLDEEIEAALSREGVSRPEETPEHRHLQWLRQTYLQGVVKTSARGLAGLKAKSRVILSQQVSDTYEDQRAVAESLASDLLRIDPAEIEGEPDPILEQIAEGRRLMALAQAAKAIPQDPDAFDPPEEFLGAQEDMWTFFRGPLLEDPPITAAGCKALAQLFLDLATSQGLSPEQDEMAFLRLIADCRTPKRSDGRPPAAGKRPETVANSGVPIPSYDLSKLSLVQLDALADACHMAGEVLNAFSCQPRFAQSPNGVLFNPAGDIVDLESSRIKILSDLAVDELQRRTPGSDRERDMRLDTLVQHEMRCEGRIGRELLAEVNAEWGA